jgi:exodeoxyribonuclease VIII
MSPGIYPDMNFADYRRIEAANSSVLKMIVQRSAAHWYYEREHPSKPTDSMQFGSAVHALVLTPESAPADIIMAPEVNKKSPKDREKLSEFVAQHADKIVLEADDYARAQDCAAAVLGHPVAGEFLADTKRELTLVWRDGQHDVLCKARYDAIAEHVIDLKTTQNASPDAFGKSAASFMYHVQAAHYWSGCEHALNSSPTKFLFVAVESQPPHAVAVYAMGSDAILAGMHLCSSALKIYKQSTITQRFDGYPEVVAPLLFPRYALMREA